MDPSNGTALSLGYSYYGDGAVETITNNLDNGRTVTYGYDALNRIDSALSQATRGADCWGQSVPSGGYDQYGNLLAINVIKCSAPLLRLSVNADNRITSGGFSYDASGDVTSDGYNSYTWDAEGQMTSVANSGAGTFNYVSTQCAGGSCSVQVGFSPVPGGIDLRIRGILSSVPSTPPTIIPGSASSQVWPVPYP